jgi:hypothetical protein
VAKNEAIYSYVAYFKSDPHISKGQPIALVEKVYGRKNAKEECAKEVLRYLKNYLARLDMDKS